MDIAGNGVIGVMRKSRTSSGFKAYSTFLMSRIFNFSMPFIVTLFNPYITAINRTYPMLSHVIRLAS